GGATGFIFLKNFWIFVFSCARHKHPHAKIRFSLAGAPPACKNHDFRRSLGA
ncbi:Os09g0269400, partial [Oryza sativa Japonica Group]